MKPQTITEKRFDKSFEWLNQTRNISMAWLPEIFRHYQLDDFRRELQLWQHIAICNDQSAYEEGHEREDLLDFVSALQKLLEAFHLLNSDMKTAKGKRKQNDLLQLFPLSPQQINLLSEKEQRHPAKAIKAFCEQFTEDYAITELLDMLDAVITYDGDKKVYKQNLVFFFQNLQWLLRLAHSI